MRRMIGKAFKRLILALIFLALLAPAGFGAGIKDTESATHGDAAASYQVQGVYEYPGFKLIQFNLAVLSHYSYLLVSRGKALVIDPGRDISAYVKAAEKEKAEIVGVFLTHSHADFVAGHSEFASLVGCPVYAGIKSGAEYKHEPVKEGSEIEVGEAVVKILETPGHTPDGLCGLVSNREDKDKPLLLLSGDTLFIGSLGRPDLMEGTMTASALAGMMYDTWFGKLSRLPDETAVYPAHGAGSLCGAHLSDEPTSTIGAQKKANPYVQHKGRGAFIAAVLEGLPEAPQYFKHNALMNRQGPPLVDRDNLVPPESAPDKVLSDPAKGYVVDLRDSKQYAAGHIPNALNIGLRGRLETWVGIMIPWGASMTLCGSEDEIREAMFRLTRVGYSGGWVTIDGWRGAGLAENKSKLFPPKLLSRLMNRADGPVIVDVRLPNEWMGLRIGQVLNLPLNRLDKLCSQLEPDKPVVAVCNSAYRSSLAVGVLERNGFTDAGGLDGGTEAWIEAGLPVYGAETKAAPAPVPSRAVDLPPRVDPAELARLLKDLPGTFDLVDIRPPQAFADYSIPGSINADIADVLENQAYLVGAGPLILADRDGTLAMAVAGILSRKTKREIKVLYGGVEGFWRETEMRGIDRPRPLPGGDFKPAPPVLPASGGPAQPVSPPKPPKKKSAGC